MDNEHAPANNADNVNVLLKFVQEAKEGKFTQEIPSIASIKYQRLEIQEQSSEEISDPNELILFGIS